MDKIKAYFVEVVLKKMTSAGVQSAVSALVVYLAAHQGMLEQFGITTYTFGQWPYPAHMPSGMVTLIEWDTLKSGGAIALSALAMMAMAWVWHHGEATVKGQPQSGDLRKEPEVPVEGGKREGDPK